MVNEQRNGRAARLPQNICTSEKGPSFESAINPSYTTVSSVNCVGQRSECRNVARFVARFVPRRSKFLFASVKFSTKQWISLWKAAENLPVTLQLSTR